MAESAKKEEKKDIISKFWKPSFFHELPVLRKEVVDWWSTEEELRSKSPQEHFKEIIVNLNFYPQRGIYTITLLKLTKHPIHVLFLLLLLLLLFLPLLLLKLIGS